ncbi:MAG TPA: hypothetical protein VK894_04410 [Jiangellales bacterium]|nr:hypothetical protein [Jiangellales bacterium]
MSTVLVLLRGGTRDGEETTVAAAVTRLRAVSAAPGMLDIYSRTGDLVKVAGNPDPATVFEFTGQEPAEGINPVDIHLPGGPAR